MNLAIMEKEAKIKRNEKEIADLKDKNKREEETFMQQRIIEGYVSENKRIIEENKELKERYFGLKME